MTKINKKNSIANRLARYNATILIIFFTSVVAVTLVFETLSQRRLQTERIDNDLRSYSNIIARNYQSIKSATEQIATNSLIINSLVDMSASRSYIKSTLKDLVNHTAIKQALLFDFSGNILSFAGPKQHDWLIPSLTRSVLATGRTAIIHKNGVIYISEPIKYSDAPQGGLAIMLESEDLLPLQLINGSYDYQLFVNQQSAKTKENSSSQLTRQMKIPIKDNSIKLELLIKKPSLLYTFGSWFYNIIIIGLLLIPIIYIIAHRLSHKLAQPILLLSHKINANEFPVSPIGSNDELEEVAKAYDTATQKIRDINNELEKRVFERTERLKQQTEELKLANLELQKIDEMKNQFISTVSHELRTPLTSIRGSLSLLGSKKIANNPGKQTELIKLAHRSSERLAKLIDDLLDFQKISSGNILTEVASCNVYSLLIECQEGTKGYQQKYNVLVKVDVQDELKSINVKVDSHRIRQVLDNLVSNAIKYSPTSKPVELSMQKEQATVKISVRDYGAGVPEDYRANLFTPFTQADSSDTRAHDGTGLGLSISKKFVEAHQGKIGYQSANPGSIFWISLPLISS
jgi:signal transduction histidine kinase